MQKLVIASNNKGKIKEIKEILGDKYEIIPMSDAGFNEDVEENGSSFEENALIKAKAVAETLGVTALADDSGLCADALCLYRPDGSYVFGHGETRGRILTEETGTNGFGYDCLFFSDDLQKPFGNATDEEKNSVSHRYRALCDLLGKL